LFSKDIEYSKHAQDVINERKINEEWIFRTINCPDYFEVGIDDNDHYIKAIAEFEGRFLHVVINPHTSPERIVTIFFDRRVKRKKK
jgi:hypothetical protein